MNQLTRRQGMVLIIVLIVVVLLSLGTYSFSDLMLTHHESARLSRAQLQTRLLVDSGVDFAKAFFAKDQATRTDAGGIFDNPDTFRGRTVLEDEDPELRQLYDSFFLPIWMTREIWEAVAYSLAATPPRRMAVSRYESFVEITWSATA